MLQRRGAIIKIESDLSPTEQAQARVFVSELRAQGWTLKEIGQEIGLEVKEDSLPACVHYIEQGKRGLRRWEFENLMGAGRLSDIEKAARELQRHIDRQREDLIERATHLGDQIQRLSHQSKVLEEIIRGEAS